MTEKDRQPQFSNMEPIVPERDDRIGADAGAGHSNRGSRRGGDRRHSGRPDHSAGKQQNSTPPNSGGGFWKLLVMVLLLAVAGLGYFGWQQYLQLNTLQASFDELQGKLASTDESLSQSGTALSIKIADHDKALAKHWSEIKKLWGVSNDRNKKAIAGNAKTLKGLKNSAVARQKEVAALEAKLADIKKSINTITSASLASRLEVEEAVDQLQGVTDRLNRLDGSLQQWQLKLGNRVSENEEAIDAIDAYRRKVNQDLLQLKQQLRQSGTAP